MTNKTEAVERRAVWLQIRESPDIKWKAMRSFRLYAKKDERKSL